MLRSSHACVLALAWAVVPAFAVQGPTGVVPVLTATTTTRKTNKFAPGTFGHKVFGDREIELPPVELDLQLDFDVSFTGGPPPQSNVTKKGVGDDDDDNVVTARAFVVKPRKPSTFPPPPPIQSKMMVVKAEPLPEAVNKIKEKKKKKKKKDKLVVPPSTPKKKKKTTTPPPPPPPSKPIVVKKVVLPSPPPPPPPPKKKKVATTRAVAVKKVVPSNKVEKQKKTNKEKKIKARRKIQQSKTSTAKNKKSFSSHLNGVKRQLATTSNRISEHKYATLVWATLLLVWTPLSLIWISHTVMGKEFLIDILVWILPDQVPARHIEMVIEEGLWVGIFGVCIVATVGTFLVEATTLTMDIVKGGRSGSSTPPPTTTKAKKGVPRTTLTTKRNKNKQ